MGLLRSVAVSIALFALAYQAVPAASQVHRDSFDADFDRMLKYMRRNEEPPITDSLNNCDKLKGRLRSRNEDVAWLAGYLVGHFGLNCLGHELCEVASNKRQKMIVRMGVISSLGEMKYVPSIAILSKIIAEPYTVFTSPSASSLKKIDSDMAEKLVWCKLANDSEPWTAANDRQRLKLIKECPPTNYNESAICDLMFKYMPIPSPNETNVNILELHTLIAKFPLDPDETRVQLAHTLEERVLLTPVKAAGLISAVIEKPHWSRNVFPEDERTIELIVQNTRFENRAEDFIADMEKWEPKDAESKPLTIDIYGTTLGFLCTAMDTYLGRFQYSPSCFFIMPIYRGAHQDSYTSWQWPWKFVPDGQLQLQSFERLPVGGIHGHVDVKYVLYRWAQQNLMKSIFYKVTVNSRWRGKE